MLYDGSNPILRITAVEHLRWRGGYFEVMPRAYSSLAFRISGSVTVNCGGREHYVNTNDILYMPQNMGYTARYTDTEILVIHFVTLRDDSDAELYAIQSGEQIYKMFMQAYALWEQKEAGFPVFVTSLLYGILGTILEKKTHASLPKHFLTAVSFLNKNYKSNTITVNEACDIAGISPTVFRQLFHKHYQKTPLEYITELRLEYARNLISGGTPIEAAAYESGFNDPKYFARVVKKRFGCTPREFKTYGK